MIKYSVIIPTYNRSFELDYCLESLKLQTFKEFEVIVIDDGSHEDIKSVVAKFDSDLNIKYLRLETPSGGAATPRNEGIKKSNAEYLCFLDSDDWWYPTKLEEVDKLYGKFDVIYHNLDCFDKRPLLKRSKVMRSRRLHAPVFIDLMTNHNTLITSSVTIKKSLVQAAGLFSIGPLEDWDLWLKCSQISESFYFLDKILGGYWAGGGNTTQISEVEITRLITIRNRFIDKIPVQYMEKSQAAHQFILGRIYHKMGNIRLALENYKYAFLNGTFYIKAKSLFFIGSIFFNSN